MGTGGLGPAEMGPQQAQEDGDQWQQYLFMMMAVGTAATTFCLKSLITDSY